MPGPAARMGDPTMHGGTIVMGFPTVLIGGQPAARVGDMHVCPMVTPATPPIPHVGMPIASPGAPTVIIGNMPAATVGSIAPCTGPPDSVMMGCPTVILGAAGAGSASGGGGGGGGGAAASASAASAQFDNAESVTQEEHWIEFEFVDKAGLPVSGVPYTLEDPDGNESEGSLRVDGSVRRDDLESDGQGRITVMNISGAEWSVEEAQAGDTVEMRVDVDGVPDGIPAIFMIYKRDIQGPDAMVTTRTAQVSGNSASCEWSYEYPPEWSAVQPEVDNLSGGNAKPKSSPVFFFEVIVLHLKARSAELTVLDTVEVEVYDDEGNPYRDQDYMLYLASGEVRRGRTNGQGLVIEEDVPIGFVNLHFPGLVSPPEGPSGDG